MTVDRLIEIMTYISLILGINGSINTLVLKFAGAIDSRLFVSLAMPAFGSVGLATTALFLQDPLIAIALSNLLLAVAMYRAVASAPGFMRRRHEQP